MSHRGASLSAAGILAALLAAAPVAAAPTAQFCGSPHALLLTVESTEVRLQVQTFRRTTFILTDGTVVDSQVENAIVAPRFQIELLPAASQIVRGAASQADFESFASALAAARPGVAHDCLYLIGDLPDFTEFRLTWYGKGKRKNTFLVSQEVAGPICSQEVNDLIDRFFDLRYHTLKAPSSEVLSSVP